MHQHLHRHNHRHLNDVFIGKIFQKINVDQRLRRISRRPPVPASTKMNVVAGAQDSASASAAVRHKADPAKLMVAVSAYRDGQPSLICEV